ncbi:hypothetical protein ACH5RR_023063 [Cinchona calisaya]|uniref:Uncharacterized protein n=1 Tax=Cinchona calisaya TaxID=153742 RepID=A0ABD2ZBF6_9GENT
MFLRSGETASRQFNLCLPAVLKRNYLLHFFDYYYEYHFNDRMENDESVRKREAKGHWDVKFPYLGDLEIVYGKGRATGDAAEDSVQAVQNFEDDRNLEEEDEKVDSAINLDNDNEDGDEIVYGKDRATGDAVEDFVQAVQNIEDMKLSSVVGGDLETQFQQISGKFGSFMEGIQANFITMATVMANEDKREQLALDRSNKVVEELLKHALSQGDVFNTVTIFSAETS